MKKSLLKFVLSFAAAALVVSCMSDDNGPAPDPDPVATCSDGVQNGDETGVDCGGSCTACVEPPVELSGEVTEDTELDASKEYTLTGSYIVKAGASLTIPAGTTIKASGGTAAFIGVERGAQIFINGTAAAPVIMTSDATSPAQGDWGGLVIAGDAPTNKGEDVLSEVGDLTYGGSTADDDSGSITYLRVEYTGATFSNDKEFNGVSLFGVGSGTTFEYVQSFNGGDDGIEFFGGTVDGNYLVSIGSGDDSIDFADGWTGSGSNWYIAAGAKAGIEGSNNGDNGDATPVTTTTLSNITVVGPVTEGALFFKEGGGNFTIDNFYASDIDLAIHVTDGDTPAATRIENGDLAITNIQFADPATGFEATDYTGLNQAFYTEGVATGAGNGAASPDWAAGWTTGLENSASSSENLAGEITGDVELSASVEYFLTSGLIVKAGGSLTIPAGTTIKASGGTAAFIGVERGAQIFINGTAAAPVVMTSSSETPAQGDWGGLVIAGDAPTNKGDNVLSEVGDLTYGGNTSDDDSGSITYLRVEYTGATFSNEKEFNGVSLFGVGSGTTFEYVQSYNGGDDGIEFFGGTVNGNYLVSIGSGDDSIDFADGWTGNGSNWYIAGGAKAGIEGSNNGDDGDATPVTTTTLSNITVVGPVTEGALFFKEGGGNFTITNFYTSGVDLGVNVTGTDAEAAVRIEADALSITPIQFDAPAMGLVNTNYAGANQDFYTVGDNTGAGNGAGEPDWAAGWTVGIE
ncbi:beta strand repeat-containing protein [Flagellimonas sp.]|uniref:beta strand repeat-containing protein n=1 Tax=Flagellimonas sp. TaxID=2058762 RepID=UPI003BACDDFC